METIYIYTLTDPITNEIRYVGKTNNLVRRLNAHIKRSKTNKYHSARWINSLIDKGFKPVISIIEECTEKNWEEREIYWIGYYRELFDLTNVLDGGGHTATYGRLGKPWSEEQKINNRKARLGMSVNHTDEGKKNRANGIRKYCNENKKKVFQYSLDGEFIKEWDSAVDAGLELNITHSNITKVCKGERKKTGEFIWSYDKIKVEEYKRKELKTKKPVLQLNVNNEIINEFESVSEAARTLDILTSSILNCLKGRCKSSGGFKWEYKNNINDKK
jgi:group I intron endonuclease